MRSDTQARAWAWARLCVFVGVLLVVFVVEQQRGWDDVRLLREQVESAGALGAVAFVAGYAALTLLPAPKGLLTALGGALYGLWLGALLSWIGALAGAVLAFCVGRALGRDAVDRLAHGRVARADELLTAHGFWAVVAVRLVPVLPFTVINYAAALTGVRWRDYLLGSAVGMVPGAFAYAAMGAWGTSSWGVLGGVSVLVAVALVGGLVGRWLLRRSADDAAVAAAAPEPTEPAPDEATS